MASHLPSTMKAAKRVGSGPLDETLTVSTDVPLPKNAKSLPADYVIVKVAYTSLNPFDFKVAEAPVIGSLAFQGIPCLDFAGVVVESNAPRFKTGELIYGQTQPMNFGACAEYVVVAGKYCMPVPNGVELEDASTIGIAGLMAYQTIGPFVKSGAQVFIIGGSGGVGTYGIQIAKAIVCSVTTTCSGANIDLCKSLGADEVIDYRTHNIVEILKCSSKRYDLIVDNIFMDPQLYWSSHDYLKSEGRYVTIAASPKLCFIKNILSIMLWPTFLGGGQRKFQLVGRTPNAQDYEQIAEWIRQGTVKVVIEQTFELEDVREAFKRLKSGRTHGKLVVKVAPK
jgi:NADPH:quinone reductase-like Zn-dependent oxidoreductase